MCSPLLLEACDCAVLLLLEACDEADLGPSSTLRTTGVLVECRLPSPGSAPSYLGGLSGLSFRLLSH